jgi:hypothetical protein
MWMDEYTYRYGDIKMFGKMVVWSKWSQVELVAYMLGERAFTLVGHAELKWFQKRFHTMLKKDLDFLGDIPFVQEMQKQGFLKGLAEGKAEGKAEGEIQGKISVACQFTIDLVSGRFPELEDAAKECVVQIKDPQRLRLLFMEINLAQSKQQAIDALERARQN